MARNIAYVRKVVYGKSAGSDMEARSGYNSRDDGVSERTGERFAFACRGDLVHHEILYPEGAKRFADAQAMWRANNVKETRVNAQFAYEIVLPLSTTLPLEASREMARDFWYWYRGRHGVPAQMDIHSGAKEEADSDSPSLASVPAHRAPPHPYANPHVHLLMPTRMLGPGGFGDKTRHLNPPFYKGCVMEEEYLRQAWSDFQQRWCADRAIAFQVDPTGFVPLPRLGPPRGWKGRPDALASLALVRRANADAACDPDQILDKLTQGNASFTKDDLEWLLRKHLACEPDAEQRIATARADVLAHHDLRALTDKATNDWSGRYSTRRVIEQEAHGLAQVEGLLRQSGKGGDAGTGSASPAAIHAALARRPLMALAPDQRAAFDYAVAPGLIKVVRGRAGTGKSYALGAIREAFENADPNGMPRARVIGLSHMHLVKEDMKADGFREAYTVEHMLKRLEQTNGDCWNGVAMVAVDEAAMLSTAQLAGTSGRGNTRARIGLLEWAQRTGTKLVLVGDDRQLPSIERGGLFTEITARLDDRGEAYRARELTTVRRQRQSWQREVAQDLARYDFARAIDALDEERTTPAGHVQPGRIDWCDGQAAAVDALVDAWTRDAVPVQDGAPDRMDRQYVFAYTHGEVDLLNRRLRAVRRATGRMAGEDGDVLLDVCYRQPEQGKAREIHRGVPFAVGDRIQFTDTSAKRGIFNGNLATLTAIRRLPDDIPHVGAALPPKPKWEMVASMDTASGAKRTVRWTTDAFDSIRHGYAGTIWKAQGKTVDRTYSLFGPRWDAPTSYVALTRHREELRLFVPSRGGRRDRVWLAEAMARQPTTRAASAWHPHPLSHTESTWDVPLPVDLASASSDTMSPLPPGTGQAPRVVIGLDDGKERFLARLQKYQQDREALAHEYLREWRTHVALIRAAAARADQPAIQRGKQNLAKTAQEIVAQTWMHTILLHTLSQKEGDELSDVLNAKDVAKAIETLSRKLKDRPRHQYDRLRTRPNGRGT